MISFPVLHDFQFCRSPYAAAPASGSQDDTYHRARVVADDVAQHAHQHGGAYQAAPALGDRHPGGGGGAADIGVGGDDGVLQVEFQQPRAGEAEEHVHHHHQEGQHQEQGRFRENGVDIGRDADDEQEQIDQIGADLLGAVELLHRAGEEGSGYDREGGDPHVLAAQEFAYEVQEALLEVIYHAVHREGAEQSGDQVGDPHHHHGESNIHGHVLQGDVLAAPEGGGLGLGVLPAGGALLHFIDMGMGEAAAEEAHSGKGDEDEEIEGHQEVIRHGGRGGDGGALQAMLHGHGGEVHAAADIGPGHHGGHRRQVLRLSAGGGIGPPKGEIGQQGANNGARRADEEDGQHLARLAPDLLQVALEQQQGDAHRDDDAPDDVVVQHALDGENADIGHDHGKDQRDDRAGYSGGPAVLLL